MDSKDLLTKNLWIKMQDLKKSFIKDRMYDKILMEESKAINYHDTDESYEQFSELPEVFYQGDDWSSYIMKIIRYQDGKMYCVDPSTYEIEDFVLEHHLYMFPLEVLVEVMQY